MAQPDTEVLLDKDVAIKAAEDWLAHSARLRALGVSPDYVIRSLVAALKGE